MAYDPRMMIKQFVGELKGRFCRFRVFETGNPKYYLFCALDPHGCDHGLHIPIKKTDLKYEVRRALKGGR